MGNGQSQSREERPRKSSKKNNGESNENIIKINRAEMPEEYQAVLLSDAVVQQVFKSEQNTTNDQRTRELDEELAKQREQNKRLIDQLRNLEEKRAIESASAAASAAVSAVNAFEMSARNLHNDEIEEKRRIFEETAKKVEKTFFSKNLPDACADKQKEIVDCLAKFPGQILSCHSLLDIYRKCVNNYRMKLIDEQSEANKT